MARTFKMRIPGTPAGNFNPDRTVNYRLTTSGYTSFTLESEVSNSELIFLGSKTDLRRIDAIESNLSKLFTVLNSTSISDTDAISNKFLAYTGGTLTGSLVLTSGSTTVPTLRLTSGTTLTTPLAGAIEWNGTNLFVTQTTGPTRKTIAFTDSNITGSAATLTTARTIALSGDGTGSITFDGSADRTIALTLATVATAGTYNSVIVNAKGLVTSGVNNSYLTTESDTLSSVTGRGATTSTAISITNATGATSTSTGALIITGGVGVGGTIHASGFVGALTGNASTATALSTSRTFALAGDISGSVSSTLSAGYTITTTLPNVATAGTFNNVVINAKGLVTSGSTIAYLTSEADTLSSVTGRGASTGTAISITNATASTTTATGALIITGGVGIGGRLNIGSTLTLPAGTTTVPALVLTSGAQLTTAAAGTVEWNGTNLFVTQTTGPTRKTIAFTDSNITGSAATLTTARTIALSGDGTGSITFDGSADRTIALTLATVATAGTFNNVVINAKGLVTSGSTIAYLTNEADTLSSVTGRGATTGTALSITNATGATSTSTGALIITGGMGVGGTIHAGGFVGNLTGNASTSSTATSLATARTIALSGDGTGSITFDGSVDRTIALTLATVATAGTYNSVVVNAKGLVTSGVNNAYLTSETDTLASVTGRGATTTTSITTTNATASTTTGTGALVVTGGVGIGGRLNIGSTLTLPAGTTTVPALVLTSGVQLTTASAGAVEWNGTDLFVTQTTGPTRKTIAYTDGNITGNAATATALSTSRTFALAGDISGSVSSTLSTGFTITSTLPNISTAGTFNNVVINAKGLVTSGSTIAYLTSETDTLSSVTGRGSTTGTAVSITNATGATSTSTGALIITGGMGVGGTIHASGFVGALTGNASTSTSAAALTTARTIALSGDGTGNITFDGSVDRTIALTLATVATAGTYNSVVVNAKGLVTSGLSLGYLTAETDTLSSVTGRGATTGTAISITNATASTTTGTGALIITGGVGIGGRLNIGSTLTLPAGTTTVPALVLTSGVQLTTASAGTVEWNGTDLFVTQTTGPTRKTIAYTDGNITGNAATATALSTSRTFAIAGDTTGSVSSTLSAGFTITSTLANTTVTPGTYTLSTVVVDAKGRITSASSGVGGSETDTLASVTGRGATTGTAISITNATASTTTGTGALIITGGVGIGGAINTGGSITAGSTFANNLTIAGSTTTNPVTITAVGSDTNIGISLLPKGSGTVIAQTAAVDTNTTQLATTAYVLGQAGSSNPVINGTAAPGTSLRWSRQDHVHPTDTTRAPIASPTFTGTVTLPAGTTTVPNLVLTSGVTLTTPLAGVVEWNGTNLFVTQTTGPTRKTIAFTDSNITGSAATLTIARAIALSGDGTGSITFDGSADRTIALTLATVATAGTFNNVVINAKGLVTSGSTIAYLTSETDTLSSVTGRGATTGTAISITNATASTTTGTGALIITGGVGIGGRLNIGSTLTLPAGTTTVPNLVLTSGVQLTTASAGAVEWDGANLFVTQTTGPTRKTIAYLDSSITGNAATATALSTSRTFALAGDISGSVSSTLSAGFTITSTLPNIATAGTFNNVVVNTKGQVTSGSTIAYLTSETDTLSSVTGRGATTGTAISITNATASTTTGTGALIITGGVGIGGRLNIGSTLTLPAGTTTVPALVLTSGAQLTTAAAGAIEWNGTNLFVTQTTGPTRKTIAFTDSNITGSAATLTTARTIALSGDGTGSITFDGSADRTIALALANTTVTPGTYTLSTVVVDAKGRITSASNGTGGGGAEVDTLATVTGRGATTGTAISITNATASTTTATGALIITGGVGIGGAVNTGGPILGPNGTLFAGSPTYSFTNDTDTGMLLLNGTLLALSFGGAERLSINATSINTLLTTRALDGSASSPAYSFTNDTDTGMYLSSVGNLSFSVGGSSQLTLSANAISANSSRFFGISSGSSLPSYSFTGDTDSGLFNAGADSIGLSTGGGTGILGLTNTNVYSTVPILAPSGTATAPSIVFDNANLETGFYYTTTIAVDTIHVSTDGVQRLSIDKDGLIIRNTNSLTIAGSTTTNPTSIVASGSDTDIGIILAPKGQGGLFLTNGTYFGIQRDMPTTVGTCVDIGTFTLLDDGGRLEININSTASSWIFSKCYNILLGVGKNTDVWFIINPTSERSSVTFDFQLEGSYNSSGNFLLRIRRTSGTAINPNTRISIMYYGLNSVFTPSTATSTPAAITNRFNSNSLDGRAFALPRIRPSLYLPFIHRPRLPRYVNTNKVSITNSFNDEGNLTELGLNNIGYDHDPATLEPRGLFFPRAVTNVITNPNCEGATTGVLGSGGVLPTNFAFEVATPAGITTTITAASVENGIPFFSVRVNGTPGSTTTSVLRFLGATSAAAATAQTWSVGCYVGLSAGNMTNLTGNIRITERNGSGTALSSSETSISPTTALLRKQFVKHTRLFTDSTSFATSELTIGFTSGQAVDATFRIGLPVLMQYPVIDPCYAIRPPVGTPGTSSLARQEMQVNAPQILDTEGTFFIEASSPSGGINTGALRILANLSDGTTSNAISFRFAATGNLAFAWTIAGSASFTNDIIFCAPNTPFKAAFTYNTRTNTIKRIVMTSTGVSSGIATISGCPTGLTQLRIGKPITNVDIWDGHIRNVMYWPHEISEYELSALVENNYI